MPPLWVRLKGCGGDFTALVAATAPPRLAAAEDGRAEDGGAPLYCVAPSYNRFSSAFSLWPQSAPLRSLSRCSRYSLLCSSANMPVKYLPSPSGAGTGAAAVPFAGGAVELGREVGRGCWRAVTCTAGRDCVVAAISDAMVVGLPPANPFGRGTTATRSLLCLVDEVILLEVTALGLVVWPVIIGILSLPITTGLGRIFCTAAAVGPPPPTVVDVDDGTMGPLVGAAVVSRC